MRKDDDVDDDVHVNINDPNSYSEKLDELKKSTKARKWNFYCSTLIDFLLKQCGKNGLY